MTKIAFIGLGNMGGPMAQNCVKKGFEVYGVDVMPAQIEALVAAGGKGCANLQEAVADVDGVITMLPAGRHVCEVYLGDNGIINLVKPGTVLIDSSTIDVNTARKVNKVAAEKGLLMVDAPVSGGTAGAQGGTLTFMVGGTEQAFAKAVPFLEAMGKNVIHAGQSGSGQAVKLCNNMVLGAAMIAVSEAFNLAKEVGLDQQVLFDICSKATAQCWALNVNCPVPGPVPTSPANRNYQPGFTSAMMLKDLRLVQDVAKEAGVATPMGARATALYEEYVATGGSDKDFSGIITMLQQEEIKGK